MVVIHQMEVIKVEEGRKLRRQSRPSEGAGHSLPKLRPSQGEPKNDRLEHCSLTVSLQKKRLV